MVDCVLIKNGILLAGIVIVWHLCITKGCVIQIIVKLRSACRQKENKPTKSAVAPLALMQRFLETSQIFFFELISSLLPVKTKSTHEEPVNSNSW